VRTLKPGAYVRLLKKITIYSYTDRPPRRHLPIPAETIGKVLGPWDNRGCSMVEFYVGEYAARAFVSGNTVDPISSLEALARQAE